MTKTLSTARQTLRLVANATPRSRYIHSTSRLSASGTNTISVDPRVLDGSAVCLPKENADRLMQWQTGLWERLSSEIRNNPGLSSIKHKWDSSGLDMAHLLTFTAKDPSLSLAFNYASALMNNSYFLEGISAEGPQAVPNYLETSAQHLCDKVEAYADGIIGGGWLWIARVGGNHDEIDIIPTFGHGTLLVSHRSQIGRDDIPIYGTPSSSSYTSIPPSDQSSNLSQSSSSSSSPSSTLLSSSSQSTSRSSRNPQEESSSAFPPLNQATIQRKENEAKKIREGILPTPLAVLNLYEMAWLGSKYGVWDRRQYAGDWFRGLDWSRIANRGRI